MENATRVMACQLEGQIAKAADKIQAALAAEVAKKADFIEMD